MKKLIFASCLALCAYSFEACNSSNSNNNGGDSTKATTDTTSSSAMSSTADSAHGAASTVSSAPLGKDDSTFAIEAANGSMMEVALGKVAQQNGTSQRVKDFGAMMIKDHTAAGDKLKALTSAKNFTLPATPDAKAQSNIDKYSKKTGKDFDKAYMDMMLDDHKKDVKAFQKAAADCKDADLKSFASTTLPTLQTHLDSAMAITSKK